MKLGFIGTGKIAAALIEGFCTAGIPELQVNVSPRNELQSKKLAAAYSSVTRMSSNQEVIERSDFIFVAVRPAVSENILHTVQFRERHTVISLVPFLKYANLAKAVAPAINLCRAIPLPPVSRHQCPIPLFMPTPAVIDLFSFIGQPLPVPDEQQLHALWTLTGLITPYYELMETLSGWTINQGVPPETANTYLAQLFFALASLAQQTKPVDFRQLAAHAATPQGMNEKAGKEILESGAHQAYMDAANRLLKRFPLPTAQL